MSYRPSLRVEISPCRSAEVTRSVVLPLRLSLQPMVRRASCPSWGRYSEGEWSLRGLEAHATMDGGAVVRDAREWCSSLPLPRSPGMQQPPRHGPHLVEAPSDLPGEVGVNGACRNKQSKMNVDFLR
jgi:hypothetical protein